MQIQVNSDNSVAVDQQRKALMQSLVGSALERFEARLTRVEVHLSDVNGARSGKQDKRCALEVRAAGRDPVAVTDHGDTEELAVRSASQKMKRLLETTFGRLGENV
ncbi:hypothetical protein F183_A09580 [Bryobacterales bacterium F-183]|nr:hypothetical protein F183_A09580 [Bryobacterales bacterium F-183]